MSVETGTVKWWSAERSPMSIIERLLGGCRNHHYGDWYETDDVRVTEMDTIEPVVHTKRRRECQHDGCDKAEETWSRLGYIDRSVLCMASSLDTDDLDLCKQIIDGTHGGYWTSVQQALRVLARREVRPGVYRPPWDTDEEALVVDVVDCEAWEEFQENQG